MSRPPVSEGGLQESVTSSLPGMATTSVGTPGRSTIFTGAVRSDPGLDPALLAVATEKEYHAPKSRSSNHQKVPDPLSGTVRTATSSWYTVIVDEEIGAPPSTPDHDTSARRSVEPAVTVGLPGATGGED